MMLLASADYAELAGNDAGKKYLLFLETYETDVCADARDMYLDRHTNAAKSHAAKFGRDLLLHDRHILSQKQHSDRLRFPACTARHGGIDSDEYVSPQSKTKTAYGRQ